MSLSPAVLVNSPSLPRTLACLPPHAPAQSTDGRPEDPPLGVSAQTRRPMRCKRVVDAVELPLVDSRECSIPVEDSPLHSFSLVPSAVQCNHMDCVGVTHRISSQRRVSASTGRKLPWPTSFPEHHRTRLQ